MVAHLTGPGKGDKYFNDQRAGCGTENSAGQVAHYWLKLGGVGGIEVFLPACTSDMSVLDVLVHKMGARTAKIRPDKLSENDAVTGVYPEFFWTPYDDESHQDKATREKEEKEEAKLEEAEEVMCCGQCLTLNQERSGRRRSRRRCAAYFQLNGPWS